MSFTYDENKVTDDTVFVKTIDGTEVPYDSKVECTKEIFRHTGAYMMLRAIEFSSMFVTKLKESFPDVIAAQVYVNAQNGRVELNLSSQFQDATQLPGSGILSCVITEDDATKKGNTGRDFIRDSLNLTATGNADPVHARDYYLEKMKELFVIGGEKMSLAEFERAYVSNTMTPTGICGINVRGIDAGKVAEWMYPKTQPIALLNMDEDIDETKPVTTRVVMSGPLNYQVTVNKTTEIMPSMVDVVLMVSALDLTAVNNYVARNSVNAMFGTMPYSGYIPQ